MSLEKTSQRLAFAVIGLALVCPAYLVWSAGAANGVAWIDFAILGLCLAISVPMSYLAIRTRANRLEMFFLVTGIGAALLFAAFEVADLFMWHHWGAASVSRYAGARMVAAGDWMLFSIVAAAIVATPIRWIARIVGVAGAWLAFSLSSFEIVPAWAPLSTPWRSGSIVLGAVAIVVTLQSWHLIRRTAFQKM